MTPGDVATLIDTHAAPLLLYARQLCDAAEDVVQEAFVKLVSQSHRPDEVVGWLQQSDSKSGG